MKNVSICAMVCLFLLFQGQAQSTDREVIAIAGSTDQNSQISMSWTLGELAINQFENNSISVSEGFHQVDQEGVPIEDLLPVFGQIKVFPNPTTHSLQIEREYGSETLYALLTDINGQVILIRDIYELAANVDLSSLASGLYILRLSDGSKRFQNYRIQKR